jgi:N-acetylmuramoyl-L-alanine amidase
MPAANWGSEPTATISEPKPASPSPPISFSTPAVPPILFPVPGNEKWVSLARWCQNIGLSAPALLSASPLPTYELSTKNGNFLFCAGSQVAHWSGTELRLGFSPLWIDRQPYIHRLDLSKTVVPLILESTFLYSNLPVLVLDPGHGGEDAGARSAVERAWEKQFTLDWARRVQSLLATNGWQVFLTRTNDVEMALSNRVSFAAEHHADLFLSLHFNSAGTNTSQAGLETYCLTPAGMPSTITRGYEDDPGAEFPNNAFDAQNLQLAFRLHRALLQVNGHKDRGVRRARFLGVLRNQQRPAILIEGGYLSNAREAQLIGQPAYRQKLAEAVALGLSGDMFGKKKTQVALDSHP